MNAVNDVGQSGRTTISLTELLGRRFDSRHDPEAVSAWIVVPTALVWRDALKGLIGRLLQQFHDAVNKLWTDADERRLKRFRGCVPGSLSYAGDGLFKFRTPGGKDSNVEPEIYVAAGTTSWCNDLRLRNRKDYEFDLCWFIDGIPGVSGPFGERHAASLLRQMFDAWSTGRDGGERPRLAANAHTQLQQ